MYQVSGLFHFSGNQFRPAIHTTLDNPLLSKNMNFSEIRLKYGRGNDELKSRDKGTEKVG